MYNEATNAISISALVDGDVNLGDSEQAVTQLNNCDDGEVTCDNVGSNFLALIANGDDAEANLDTNAQTSSQTNDCDTAGNTCSNSEANVAVLNALDNAVITISDNTQTSEQSNDCTSTFVDTKCSNFKTNQFLATATDASTITGSNTQIDTQANTCPDAAMWEIAPAGTLTKSALPALLQ